MNSGTSSINIGTKRNMKTSLLMPLVKLGKDIKIPEGIDIEKDPDKHRKVADEFYEKVWK